MILGNYVKASIALVSLAVIAGCKTTSPSGNSTVKDFAVHQIDLIQLDRGEPGYTPDPGMFYVWDNGTGNYHVEIDERGTQGFYWISNQKYVFENGCRRGSSDISCSGTHWTFYAPMRMDALTHIYAGGVMRPVKQQKEKIELTQIEAADGGYTPDPGMYYVWDSADRRYHVEMSSDGRLGAIWINNQKMNFEACRRRSSDMSCEGAGWKFYAPMRMDAPHHIYGSAILEQE